MRTLALAMGLLLNTALAQDTLYPVAKNGKWGLIAGDRREVLAPRYDYVELEKNTEKFIYYLNGKKGLISADGKVLSKPEHDDIVFFDSLLVGYRKEKLWSLYRQEKQLLAPEYSSIAIIADQVFEVEKNAGKQVYHAALGKFCGDEISEVETFGNVVVYRDTLGVTAISMGNFDLILSGLESFEAVGPDYLILSGAQQQFLLDVDSACVVASPGEEIRMLDVGKFFIASRDGNKIYLSSKDKTYPAPAMNYLVSLSYPELYYSIEDYTGIWNLERNQEILPPFYDAISKSDGVYYLYRNGSYGIADGRGRVIVKAEYGSIDNYDNFYVVSNGGLKGILSSSGREIEKCIYKDIRVYGNKAKCFTDTKLVVVDIDNGGAVTDRTSYNEYMTMSFAQQRMPTRKSEDVRFGGGGQRDPSEREAMGFGWFWVADDTTGVPPERRRGKWGLKDETDSVYIQPKYASVAPFKNCGLTKAYLSRPFSDYVNSVSSRDQTYPITTFGTNINAIFNANFALVDHRAKKLTSRTKFKSAHLEDLDSYSLARAMSTWLCLIDSSGQIVMDSLSFFDNYSEGFLAINKGGNLSRNEFYGGSSSSAYEFLRNIGAWNIYSQSGYLHVDGGEWYFVSRDGKIVNEEPFEFVNDFQNNRAIVKRNGKWGVIDTTMKEIVPIAFSTVEEFNNWSSEVGYGEMYRVSNSSNQGFLYNKISGSLEPTSVFALKNHYNGRWFMQDRQGGNWALVDTSLKPLTGFDFTYVSAFEDGHALVVQMGKRSLIDDQGNVVLPWYKAKDITYLGHDRYAVEEKSGLMVVNSRGDTLVKSNDCSEVIATSDKYIVYRNKLKKLQITDDAHSFKLPKNTELLSYSLEDNIVLLQNGEKRQIYDLGLYKVSMKDAGEAIALGESCMIFQTEDKKCGIVNLKGDTLLRATYKEILPVTKSWTFAKLDKRYSIIDQRGKLLDSMEVFRFKRMGENFLIYCRTGVGLLSADAKWIIEPNYSTIEIYNGIFYKTTFKNGLVDIYDFAGEKLIDESFEDVCGIHPDGLIVTRNRYDYLWSGYLNSSLSFQNVIPVSSELYILRETRKVGIYDYEGKIIVPVEYHKADLIQNAFQVRYFNSFGFYTTTGEVIFDPKE